MNFSDDLVKDAKRFLKKRKVKTSPEEFLEALAKLGNLFNDNAKKILDSEKNKPKKRRPFNI